MLLRVVGPVVAQSLKPVKLFAPCKETQHCELLRPFARAHSPKCGVSKATMFRRTLYANG